MPAKKYSVAPVSRVTTTFKLRKGSVATPSRTIATLPGTPVGNTAYGMNQQGNAQQPPTAVSLQTLQQVVTFGSKFPQNPYYSQLFYNLPQQILYVFYNGQWIPLPLFPLAFFG